VAYRNQIHDNAFASRRGARAWDGEMHEYQERAAECLQLANEATSPRHRARLLEMAQSWLRLLEQAEKNAQSDLAYETPPPRESITQMQQQQQQRAKDEN
jgi:hypothetical protein